MSNIIGNSKRYTSVWTPDGEHKVEASSKVGQPGVKELCDIYEQMAVDKNHEPDPIIVNRIRVPLDKVDRALAFWRPRYYEYTVENRNLNGIEAYDIGDPTKNDDPNPVPYIAMCNIMALEALVIMGESMPSVEDADKLLFGTDREKLIAKHWKETYACTSFQATWAVKSYLAILAGNKIAYQELLERYADQLP
jgi:hypothetical protein